MIAKAKKRMEEDKISLNFRPNNQYFLLGNSNHFHSKDGELKEKGNLKELWRKRGEWEEKIHEKDEEGGGRKKKCKKV